MAPQAMKDVASCDKLGELLTSDDPKISEWGNPRAVMGTYSVMNSIVTVEQTR